MGLISEKPVVRNVSMQADGKPEWVFICGLGGCKLRDVIALISIDRGVETAYLQCFGQFPLCVIMFVICKCFDSVPVDVVL